MEYAINVLEDELVRTMETNTRMHKQMELCTDEQGKRVYEGFIAQLADQIVELCTAIAKLKMESI